MQAKAYKGMGMEGGVARWYDKTTRRDLPEFKALARRVAADLAQGAKVLEVAPGPGFFAIELAKIGKYEITGLDISKSFVEIAKGKIPGRNTSRWTSGKETLRRCRLPKPVLIFCSAARPSKISPTLWARCAKCAAC